MRIFFLLAIIFDVALLFFVLPEKVREYGVSKSGTSVVVTVMRLPDCSFGYRNKFLRIKYEGRTHTILTKCRYVKNLREGQQIKMLHEPGGDIFLFENQRMGLELAAILMLVVGVTCCLFFLSRRMRSS